jgi:ankyrin repeat protein
MFPDVQELQDLPLAVQYQILDSMSKIATDPEQEQARRADACYVVAILHIQHIGTVHPRTSQSKEYTGYDIDVDQVLSWMKRGAELGSPGARSVYSQVRSACAGETDYYSVPQETLISWLTNATTLGSHIAAKCLKELDQSAWKEADEIFRTEYCGVGRKLFEDKLISYRYVPMVSLAASQISQKLENSNNTLLHLAATTGREDVVRQLCGGASYAQVNTTNVRNETPLFQATRSGHQGIVNYLLSVGASAAISSSNGENPLHWLAAFNIDELELTTLARSLIEGGADIEQMSTDNRIFNQHFRKSLGPGTPLCRAVQRDSFIAARVLIALDANPYSGEDNFPMALACSSHNSQLIGLLLSSPHPIRLPGWYNKPFLFDPEHSFEAIRAKWNKAPTFQSAAPNAWKSMEERGSESSLLGYAVAPNLLYSRMALHGSSYEDQMKLTIQQLSMLEYQDFSRVSFDYESAVMRSVISRDVSIVSYLLSSFPDEAIPTLTNPLPTGRGAHLPAQLALSMGEKPIFKVLLKYASPTAPVGVPNMQGVTDNLFARTALQLFTKRTTIATTKVSVMFKNLVQLAVAAHPDPEFMESILEPLDPEDAKALVNSHGPADEIPFTMAVGRHFFDVAEVLLKYGADIEEEGNKPANNQGFGRSPLGVLISLNNHGTSTAVAWLLQFNPSFLVNKQFELSALDMAIRAGGPYEMSADEPTILFPMRLYKFNGTVLRLLLEKFGSPEQLNHQCEGFWGMTALHWAVFRLCPEAVRILLDAGADTNIKIVIPGSKLPPLTAQELAMDLDESLVPETVKKRGDKEIKRYLRRIEDVQREFLDHLGATM